MNAVAARIGEIARDLGRLRRLHSNDGWGGDYLIDRLCENLQTLDSMLAIPASEIYRDFLAYCADEQVSVEEALQIVNERDEELRRRLSGEERR